MNALEGSSATNPWIFRDDGRMILYDVRNDQTVERASVAIPPETSRLSAAASSQASLSSGIRPGKPQIIYKGTPSTVVQPTRGSGSSGAGAACAASSTRRTRDEVSQGPASRGAAPRARAQRHRRDGSPVPELVGRSTPLVIRRRRTGPSVAEQGRREPRDVPLTEDDLYLTSVRRPAEVEPKPYHRCTVCFGMKSHPVSAMCGHSYCYVCIRKWLEGKWTCPLCVTKMHYAPVRNFSEEESIAHDYPDWDDKSKVSYTWDDLVFPTPPKVFIVPDTP
ncbi:hypothetical protein C8R44DRAFT_886589 [Mycena epipterygia]|nr:hypothetical protein C8R44DRAFT_886589 [Mycena epipterygia]